MLLIANRNINKLIVNYMFFPIKKQIIFGKEVAYFTWYVYDICQIGLKDGK